ncbi:MULTISPECIES: HypC/HybG/HupF family hydrogenase formation chaperone [unclassified Clostridium]|uniref:HypC/HybG/HupF family hydrogenase formation chaperone n=1 Tax=Clostridium TaxID=1485 RepID=UPI001C8CAFCC|nr:MULTISPECIES: HypC/HybG/HupF family hydrogenase formation chaperone [unclassified Clostridium]MBX9136818.1 HypC/HybG/HupF family hydrogenase formation chaperone [Clostridium sp. K12(2020)]MBX9143628.1 HypC/HybG/HupF family hydrogenase formation chaperone [Clostridium sp. K13]MDU2289612.1 HypC/HybG/HupF family hydrogenase formation chaperone [Clostridium celatum]
MCIAVPAKIEEILESDAIVNYNGVKVKVNIMFIENPKEGEYVLVHAGCAIQKIDEDYARETLDIFKELSNAIEECNFNGNIKRVEK